MERPKYLTDRQREIFELLGEGMPMKQIAGYLGISHHTVRTQIQNAHTRLGLHTNAALVGHLYRARISQLESDLNLAYERLGERLEVSA